MLEIDDIADVIAGAVREATAPLIARIDALEQREIPAPVVPDEEAIAERVLKAIPPPERGEAGEVDMEQVRALIDEAAQRAVEAIPLPDAPEPIAPDMDAIAKMIEAGIAEAAASLPTPEKGDPGIGLADALIDKDGQLVLTMTDGRTKALGLVVGKDGERGDDGKTFTLDDFDVEAIDERTIRLGFTGGAEKHTFELSFPVLIGRGIWAEAEDYERGDVVTWGGSAWEAVEPAKGVKPDLSSGGWRILAKRGRDGKAAK